MDKEYFNNGTYGTYPNTSLHVLHNGGLVLTEGNLIRTPFVTTMNPYKGVNKPKKK